MKKFILTITMLMTFGAVNAQDVSSYKKAIINDPDGYTNVREGKSVNYAIITRIYENEVFYAYPSSESSWYPVITINGTKGFVHNSRIKFIDTNPSSQNTDQQMSQKEAELFKTIIGALLSSSKKCKCCNKEYRANGSINQYIGNNCNNSAYQDSKFCSEKCCYKYYKGNCE